MSVDVIFGCGGAWAASWFDERKAATLLEASVEMGITRFDTGPTYGHDGLAERRLGRFLATGGHPSVSVSTKLGTHRGDNGKLYKDYSAAALRSSLEASLTRLGRDHVDLALLHGPLETELLNDELIATMITLRSEGLTTTIGASCDGAVAERLVASGAFDTLMVSYNQFERTNLQAMTSATAAGMLVIAKAPLAHGAGSFPKRPLLRRTNAWYNARLLGRRPRLVASALATRGDERTPSKMLAFVAAEPSVRAIVLGTTSSTHLQQNLDVIAAADRPNLP